MSDALAVGAAPSSALAMITVPRGPAVQQEELLYQLLAGGVAEFRRSGVTLVGGHTIEGPELVVGFFVVAGQRTWPPRGKSRLRVGDDLVLTKALGTGALLAAHMQGRCRAEWFAELISSMTAGNAAAALCADEFALVGVTDVTGFGLAGHLREMLIASDVGADLVLESLWRIPLGRAPGVGSTGAGAAPCPRSPPCGRDRDRRSRACDRPPHDTALTGGTRCNVRRPQWTTQDNTPAGRPGGASPNAWRR